jgi:hypothetical protein
MVPLRSGAIGRDGALGGCFARKRPSLVRRSIESPKSHRRGLPGGGESDSFATCASAREHR